VAEAERKTKTDGGNYTRRIVEVESEVRLRCGLPDVEAEAEATKFDPK
jgi:hypothetical protein